MTIWQNKSFSDPFNGTDKKAKIERLKPNQSPELISDNNQEIKENRNMNNNQEIKENKTMNKKQKIRINENQLKQIVTESVKRMLKEDLEKRDNISYSGKVSKSDGWNNGFTGYYVCTPTDGAKYCSTKAEAIKLIKQYYQGEDRDYILGQLNNSINRHRGNVDY